MQMAEHNPKAVYGADKGVLAMSQSQLHDYAATTDAEMVKAARRKKLAQVLAGNLAK